MMLRPGKKCQACTNPGPKSGGIIKVVCLVGPPGAGKTSIAGYLAPYGGIFRLRKEVSRQELVTQQGVAREWLDMTVVRKAFYRAVARESQLGTPLLICDNFPGNHEQVGLLKEASVTALVVQFVVPRSVLHQRIATRRVCNSCEADSLNDPRIPAQGLRHDPNACRRCFSQLVKRPNDTGDVLVRRLKRYCQNIYQIRKGCVAHDIPIHTIPATLTLPKIGGAILTRLNHQR